MNYPFSSFFNILVHNTIDCALQNSRECHRNCIFSVFSCLALDYSELLISEQGFIKQQWSTYQPVQEHHFGHYSGILKTRLHLLRWFVSLVLYDKRTIVTKMDCLSVVNLWQIKNKPLYWLKAALSWIIEARVQYADKPTHSHGDHRIIGFEISQKFRKSPIFDIWLIIRNADVWLKILVFPCVPTFLTC